MHRTAGQTENDGIGKLLRPFTLSSILLTCTRCMSPVLKILVGAWYAVYSLTWQTGRDIPPLQEDERMAKIFLGEGNFKVSTTWHSTSTVWCSVKNNRLVDKWNIVRCLFLHKCLIATYLLKSWIRVGYQWLKAQLRVSNSELVFSEQPLPSEVLDHTGVREHSTNWIIPRMSNPKMSNSQMSFISFIFFSP